MSERLTTTPEALAIWREQIAKTHPAFGYEIVLGLIDALEEARARVAELGGAVLDDGVELLARNARLEAAVKHARGVIETIMSDGNCDCGKDFAILDAALKGSVL